jgi:hypothetical protein
MPVCELGTHDLRFASPSHVGTEGERPLGTRMHRRISRCIAQLEPAAQVSIERAVVRALFGHDGRQHEIVLPEHISRRPPL